MKVYVKLKLSSVNLQLSVHSDTYHGEVNYQCLQSDVFTKYIGQLLMICKK